MGGYGPYVWGSFAVTALAMMVEPLAVRARRRAALERLKRMHERTRSVRHEATV
jgi:heme exporter protein D